MTAMEAAAWMESVRALCAWNVWHDLSDRLATGGMQHLRALARLDSRYIAEVAVVAPGLLAAVQIRRRRERQQQQQRECERNTSRLRPGRRRPKPRLLGWQEGVFWTFALAFGDVVFIHVGRGVLAEPSLPGVEEATHRVSGQEDGVPLSESMVMAMIVAAACYAVTGFSGCRRLLDHWSVQTPLGITAELLRACHVSTAAAMALALAPPLLSVAVSANDPASQEDAAISRVVVGFLGSLRLLASLVAGAAVSCVGGGGWACSVRRRRAPEAQHLRRSIVDPGGSMASLPEGRGVITGDRRRIDGGGMFADTIKDSGIEVNGGVHELRRDGEDGVEALSSTWFVPSGALGGAFYAITAGGVFGGLFRDVFSGKDWFASPESVRWALAIMYAAVFTLRSIAEISEANGSVDGATGFASTHLLPLFRLFGLKASSEDLAEGTSGVGISGQRVALNGAARQETEQLADEMTAGQSRSPRRTFSSAKDLWSSLISWTRGQNRADSTAVKPSDVPRTEAVAGDRADGGLFERRAIDGGSGATAIAALDGVQKEQQPNRKTRSRGLGGAGAAANATKAVFNAGVANAAEDGRLARQGKRKEEETDCKKRRRPRSRRSVSEVVETRTRAETEYGGHVGIGVGFSTAGHDGGRSESRGGGGSIGFSMWLDSVETWTFPSVLLVLLVRQVTLAAKRRYWADKGFDALVSSFGIAFFDEVWSVLLLRFPRGAGAGIFVATLMAAARVRSAAEKAGSAGGLPCITHGSALTFVTAFGGELLASACLGSRAMVLTEEGAIPSAVFAWMLVGGRLWGGPGPFSPGLRGFMLFAGVHHALVILAEAFRALLVCRAVESAKGLSEGRVGGSWTLAFVAGVLAGCGGMFLPGGLGLSPLSKEVPWAVQSAVYGSAFYYFADTSTLPAQAQTQAMLAMFFSAVAIARTSRRLGPAFNPFSPIHRAARRLLGMRISLATARVQSFSRIQAPAAMRRSAAAVDADPLVTKGRISWTNFSASRSRLRSFSPTPGRSTATAAAAGPCPQRSMSFSSPLVRVGSSRNNMGMRTGAAAKAKAVAGLPAEKLGSCGHATRRRFSVDYRSVSPLPVVPDDREGFELGSSRTRAFSMSSRTRRGTHTHADGGTGEPRASDRRDRHNSGRPISESFVRGRSVSDVLRHGPARRERSRLEEGGATEAARRREAGLWVDGGGFSARGVGRAVAWAAVAASLIALGRWLALTAQPGTVHPLSPHGHERDTREAEEMVTLGGDMMVEPSRVPPSGLLVLLVLLQARSEPHYDLSFFDGDENRATARSSYLGKSGGGADVGEKVRSPSISSTVLSPPVVDDCSEAVVGEFSKISDLWMGEVAEGQDLDASVTIDSCGHGPATSVAPPTSSHAKANGTPLEPRSLNSSVDGRSVVAAVEDRMNQAMPTATGREADETGTNSFDLDRQPESTHYLARAPDAGVTTFDVAVNPESLADGVPMHSPEEMENGAPGTKSWLQAMRSGGGGDAPCDTARESESKNLPPLREGSVLDEGDGWRDCWNLDKANNEVASRVGDGDTETDCGEGGDSGSEAGLDFGADFDGADREKVNGDALARNASASSNAAGVVAITDGVLAIDGVAGDSNEPIPDNLAITKGAGGMNVLDTPSCRIDEGGRAICHVEFETVSDSVFVAGRDGDRIAAVGASAADCDTGHVTVDEECIDGRSPTGMINAATDGEPQVDSEGDTGERIENLHVTDNMNCVDGSGGCISSENRACEDSDGTGLEAATFPSRFADVELPSSHAPKYRPRGLPERASSRYPDDRSSIAPIFKYVTPGAGDLLRGFSDAASPLNIALVGAVDSPPPSWIRPTNTPLSPGNNGEEARPLLPTTLSEHALGTRDLTDVQGEEESLMKEPTWSEKYEDEKWSGLPDGPLPTVCQPGESEPIVAGSVGEPSAGDMEVTDTASMPVPYDSNALEAGENGIDSAAGNLSTARLGVEEELPLKTVSPVSEDVLAVGRDARESGTIPVGLVATAAYYGAWAAITLVLA